MKTLILKIILLGSITFFISLLFHFIVYPKLNITDYSWGSENLDLKRKFLLKHKKEINTLFIGSSKWATQINPSIWDTIVTGSKSFNLSDNWLGAPETDYILRNLVNKDKFSPRIVIMELTKLKSVKYPNINSNRTHYWFNWKDYWFVLNATLSSNFSSLEKLNSALTSSIAYFDQLINFGYVSEGLRAKANLEKFDFQNTFNGFTCFDFEKYNSEGDRNFIDTLGVKNFAESSANQFIKYEKTPELLEHYNKVYLNRIIAMINLYKQKGITLIYCLPPRIPDSHYKELLPLFSKIPKNNKIELCDSRKYPTFYSVTTCYDESHLNCEGSVIFTEKLARQANKILSP